MKWVPQVWEPEGLVCSRTLFIRSWERCWPTPVQRKRLIESHQIQAWWIWRKIDKCKTKSAHTLLWGNSCLLKMKLLIVSWEIQKKIQIFIERILWWNLKLIQSWLSSSAFLFDLAWALDWLSQIPTNWDIRSPQGLRDACHKSGYLCCKLSSESTNHKKSAIPRSGTNSRNRKRSENKSVMATKMIAPVLV